MSNKDMPAYPVTGNDGQQCHGLTKLEAFTMAVLQGLIANPITDEWWQEELATFAVKSAEAALAELEKRNG